VRCETRDVRTNTPTTAQHQLGKVGCTMSQPHRAPSSLTWACARVSLTRAQTYTHATSRRRKVTQRAAGSRQQAARSTQHAARSTQHAARSKQHAASSITRGSACRIAAAPKMNQFPSSCEVSADAMLLICTVGQFKNTNNHSISNNHQDNKS
jgi:hypothetical protein